MGITIHYAFSVQASDNSKVRSLIDQLHRKAKALPFKEVGGLVEINGDNKEKQYRMLVTQASMDFNEIHFDLSPPELIIGFTTCPGDGCEPANFALCQRVDQTAWSFHAFCKTQYASRFGLEHFLRCHLTIIDLLDHAAELGILRDVKDEGGYWSKRDKDALVKTVRNWNEAIAGKVGKLKDKSQQVGAEILKFQDFEHLEANGRKPLN